MSQFHSKFRFVRSNPLLVIKTRLTSYIPSEEEAKNHSQGILKAPNAHSS